MNENVEAFESDDGTDEGKRQRSTIAFPYSDYDSAAEVTAAIFGNVGHGTCTQAQLAAWMSQSVKSSSFRSQLAAARLFGLVESDSPDAIRLSELGRRVVDPAQMRVAKAEAFLRVPLFKALYDQYKDGVTPPAAAAIEREIVRLGVGDKQKARARQVFESSAQQTGFREAAPNRLVMPAVVVHAKPPEDPEKNRRGGGAGGDDGGFELDPLLMALLRKIPKGGSGQWPAENRLRWFRTFAMNVSQVYDTDDEPIELEIKLKVDKPGA